jgi:hypothetical protein
LLNGVFDLISEMSSPTTKMKQGMKKKASALHAKSTLCQIGEGGNAASNQPPKDMPETVQAPVSKAVSGVALMRTVIVFITLGATNVPKSLTPKVSGTGVRSTEGTNTCWQVLVSA